MKTSLLLITACAALVLLVPGIAAENAFVAGSSANTDINAIAMDADRIYLGQSQGWVVAMDRETGEVEWATRQYNPPAAAIRNVFGIASNDEAVFAGHVLRTPTNDFSDAVNRLDKETGAPEWTRFYSRPDCTGAPEGVACARDALRLLAEGDDLFIGFGRGLVMKVDGRDPAGLGPNEGGGAPVWSAILPQIEGAETANIGAIASDANYIYVATNDNLGASPTDEENRIHVLDKATGQVLRSGYALVDGAVNRNVINSLYADGASLYAAMFGGYVLRLEPHDPGDATDTDFPNFDVLAQRQIFHEGGPQTRTPVSIHGDGTHVYTAHLGGWLYKFSKGTLDPAWTNTAGAMTPKHAFASDSRAVAVHDGWIAQGFDDGFVAKLSIDAGPTVDVWAPNGGEFLNAGAGHELLWTMSDHHSTNGLLENPYLVDVEFFLSSDNGATYAPQPFLSVVERAFTFNQLNRQSVFNTQSLPEGDQYRIKVKVSDPDGFSSVDFSDGAFTIDHTPPTVLEHYPAKAEAIATDRPRLSVRFADNLAGVDHSSIRFFIDDQTPRTPQEINLDSAAFTWSGSFPLAQGFHNARVVMSDMAGNTIEKQWSFRIDTVAPPNPVTTPGRNTFTSHERPLLDLRYLEDVHLVSAKFGLKGGTLADVTTAIEQPTPNRIQFQNPTALEAGKMWQLEVTVRDDVGNTATTALPFGIDVTGPALSIQALSDTPADGSITGKASMVLSVAATDNFAGINAKSVKWTFGGADHSGQVSVQNGRLLLPLKNLQSGVYTSTVDVKDNAGNPARLEWTFTVDTQAPSLDVLLLPPGSQKAVKAGDTLGIKLTMKDVEGISKVEVDWGSLDAATGYVVIDDVTKQGDVYIARGSTSIRENANLPVDISVRATDGRGNAATSVVTVMVDNVVPSSQMGRLQEFNGRSFPLTWSGSDGYGSVAKYDVQVSVDGAAFVDVVTGTKDTTLVYSTPLDVAKLRFRVFAIDEAGNRQITPGAAVETTVIGTVFESTILPPSVGPGSKALFVAALVTDTRYPVDDVTLEIRQIGNETVQTITMTRLDDYNYAIEWEAPESGGRYMVDFAARSPDGLVFRSGGQFFTVAGEAAPVLSGDKDSPGLPALAPLALLGVLAARRRR